MNSLPLRRRVAPALALVGCLSLVVVLSGCPGAATAKVGSATVNVSGTVEFDGKPVPAGTVTFLSKDTGNMAICTIDDGEFSNDADGPNPGSNMVMIVGRETPESQPMWANSWNKEITVGQTDFKEDFKISKDEVKPFDPASIQIDN